MSYELIIRDRAQIEIAEIKQWYEDNEEGLESYFLLCLDASLEAMRRYPTGTPHCQTRIQKGVRQEVPGGGLLHRSGGQDLR